MAQFTIASGGTISNSIQHQTGSMTIFGPSALTGTVKVEVSADSGATWVVHAPLGVDTVVTAAEATVIFGNLGLVRVKSSGAEGADRVFPVLTTRMSTVGAAFVGATANPMTADLDGGGFAITNIDPLTTTVGGLGADLSAAPAGAMLFSDGATPAVFGTSADFIWDNVGKGLQLSSAGVFGFWDPTGLYVGSGGEASLSSDGSANFAGALVSITSTGDLNLGSNFINADHSLSLCNGMFSMTAAGDATFGNGAITLNADGTAEFNGEVQFDDRVIVNTLDADVPISDPALAGRVYQDGGILRVSGSSLPTSDPAVAGQLWADAGTVKVSAGP